jgi:hypothetical protein
MASTPDRQTVSFEDLAYSNMLTLNALIELLDERGIISKRDVLERIKALQGSVQSSRKIQ